MKITLVLGLCFSLALIQSSPGAVASQLADNAQNAAQSLPRGCIVIAEQTGAEAPVFSVAGKQEPAGIPPEKVIFEIGSISKVFTGIMLAQAVLEKRVTLDTTLGELMGKPHSFADASVAAITLRQLATHTSGLPRIPEDLTEGGGDPLDPYARYDRARLDRYIRKAKLAHAAPFPSSYSNLGVGLLGDLLARLYNQSWEELVLERITKPLGMADTCVTLTPEQTQRLAPAYAGRLTVKPWHSLSLAGAGALRSTAADMLKFCQALEKPETTSFREAIELVEQPQEGGPIGLCLQVLKLPGQNVYWFAGGTGGFRSQIFVKPSAERLVVMLINNAELAPETVMIGKAAKPAAPDKANAPTTSADPTLTVYTGQYDTGAKAGGASIYYVFEARGSELWMQITGQPFVRLSRHPSAKDRFEFKPVQAELQFARENEKVVAITLFQSGMEIHARKLSTPGKTQ